MASLDTGRGGSVLGSIPSVAVRTLQAGSVSIKCDRLRQKSWSPRSVSVWHYVKLSDVNLGTRQWGSLVADDGRLDTKANKQKSATGHSDLVYNFDGLN